MLVYYSVILHDLHAKPAHSTEILLKESGRGNWSYEVRDHRSCNSVMEHPFRKKNTDRAHRTRLVRVCLRHG